MASLYNNICNTKNRVYGVSMDACKSEQIVDLILSYIINNELKPGDKLPSEEEMTALFKVSRVSIREGLRGLKFLGLLKSTTSRGTVVQEMDFSILARCLGFQIAVSDVSYRQLLEARLAIETAALELICGKLKPYQIKCLRKMADCKRRNNSREEILRDYRADQEFHQYLLQCSGNTVLIAFARLLQIFFSHIIDDKASSSDIATAYHEMLIDALANNNLELARGIMREHLFKYYKLIEAKAPKHTGERCSIISGNLKP